MVNKPTDHARKEAKEPELIRAQLIKGGKSGVGEQTPEDIRASVLAEKRDETGEVLSSQGAARYSV